MYVCLCKGITEGDIRNAAQAGTTTAEGLIKPFRWDDGKGCGRCALSIEGILALVPEERIELLSGVR